VSNDPEPRASDPPPAGVDESHSLYGELPETESEGATHTSNSTPETAELDVTVNAAPVDVEPSDSLPEPAPTEGGPIPDPEAADPKPFDPLAPPPRRHRFRAMVSGVAIAGVAFVTGLLLFNDLLMPRLVHNVNELRIPDLTNLTLEQAEKVLRTRGLSLSRDGERFDPDVPRGFVLSQDPPAETPFRGRKRVSVVVSLGEEFSSVPELFGESIRTSAYLLSRAGLRLGAITHAPSEDVGEGLIAASDPPAEDVLPRDTPVTVLVSTGGAEESFVMPDLLGREIAGARRQLEAYGFRVFTPPAAPSIGTIVYQDPAPGSRITRQTQILVQATGRIIR